MEGGYRIHGNVVSAFARSGAAHVRALASPGKTCTTDKRVAFDQQVDEEVAAKRAEEKRIAEEARAAIEELELQELKKRLAEEEQKQLLKEAEIREKQIDKFKSLILQDPDNLTRYVKRMKVHSDLLIKHRKRLEEIEIKLLDK